MIKNIIIGASSSIGKNILSEFSIDSIFTYYSNPIKNGIKFDILKQNIEDILDLKDIQNAVILSAISDPKICFENQKFSKEFNINS